MLGLVTGVPGSGKTLYVVKLIMDYVKANEKAEKHNRKVDETGEGKHRPIRAIYSDINGLNIPGVLPSPDDWRDTPNHSVVVYDECQEKFPPDGKGRSSRPDIAQMEKHRHSGHDLILITQHPQLLHSHIRRLVGNHYHVERIMGSNSAKIFNNQRVLKVDSKGDLNGSDSWVWGYDKKLFDLYQSATDHTHKFKLPNKVKWMIGFVLLFLFGVSFAVPPALKFFTGGATKEVISQPEKPKSIPVDQVSQYVPDRPAPEPPKSVQVKKVVASVEPEVVEYAGCAHIPSKKLCKCYTSEGRRANLSYASCRNMLENPLDYFDLGSGKYRGTRESRSPGRNVL